MSEGRSLESHFFLMLQVPSLFCGIYSVYYINGISYQE